MLYPKPLPRIGNHKSNETLYFSPALHDLDSLPQKNWICLCIANDDFDKTFFDDLMYHMFESGLVNFTGQGKHGEMLNDLFDETMLIYELESGRKLDIMTSWGDDGPSSLVNELWNCFYVRIFPEHIDENDVTVVCVSLDEKDYLEELTGYLNKFNEGWLPPDE